MKSSATIGKLAEALSKAQAEIKGAVKDSSNPFFKSKYADLESIWDAIRVPLTKNGLSVAQGTDFLVEVGTVVVTRLMHTSGEWIEACLPVMALKPEPQAMGSAITYARRYSLAGMVGVVQTDDDAESAQGRTHEAPLKSDHKISNVTRPAPTVAKETCEHKWMTSKFVDKETGEFPQYCVSCKAKKFKDQGAA
jgi:hypothetical protein